MKTITSEAKPTKCPICGCEFTFEKSDISKINTNNEKTSVFVDCAHCNRPIELYSISKDHSLRSSLNRLLGGRWDVSNISTTHKNTLYKAYFFLSLILQSWMSCWQTSDRHTEKATAYIS